MVTHRIMDAEGIVAFVDRTGGIPCGTEMGAAIDAHRRSPGELTLRTIIMACTPDLATEQRQLDYLVSVPAEGWPIVEGHSQGELRDDTLAAIRRNINWKIAGR